MQRSERIRRLMRLVPWPTLLLAAACGGDKGPTGPGGGDMEQVTYDLVSLGRVGLPTDAQPRLLRTVTRFYSGGFEVTGMTGVGTPRIQVDHQDGDRGYEDDGEVEEDGGQRLVASDVLGTHLSGHFGPAGKRLILYDWCYDGVPDVQLVFDR